MSVGRSDRPLAINLEQTVLNRRLAEMQGRRLQYGSSNPRNHDQICRPAPSIASAAANTCCGGKRDRLCLRWSRCGAASNSRVAQPFHSRSGGASPAISPKSSGGDPRSQRRAPITAVAHWPAPGRSTARALDRLSRYEHMLWRQTRQIMFTLELAPQARWRRGRYRRQAVFCLPR